MKHHDTTRRAAAVFTRHRSRMTKCCRFALAAMTVLLPGVGQIQARDYHVSGAGDDANSGVSPSRPWRSIARVNEHTFAPGDLILFRGGDRFDGNLVFDASDKSSPLKPIRVGSYGRGRATIRAGLGTGLLVKDLGGFVVRDLIVEGTNRLGNKGSGIKFINTLPGNTKLSFLRIENVEASRFGREGIYVGGDPPDKSQSGYEDVRITNCVAHDNAYYGIYVTGVWDERSTAYANKNVVIAYSTAYDNPGDPDYLENHSGSGILLDDVDTGRIEYCAAYNNGYLCNAKVGGPVGIWAHAANNVTIQYCTSYRNRTGKGLDGGGFDFDGGVTNSVMQYNYSSGNDGAGYLIYTYKGAPHMFRNNIIRYNISENDGQKNTYSGLFVVNDGSGVRDLEIYNNTIFVSPATRGGTPRAVIVKRTENVHFRNNLLMTTGGTLLLEVGEKQPGLLFQGNNYWSSGAAFRIEDAGKIYDSLAAWRAAQSRETNAEAATGLSVDPGLHRPGAGETVSDPKHLSRLNAYRLRPGSPMIDAGLNLRLSFNLNVGGRDFWGNAIPQGNAFDVGAHEASQTAGRKRQTGVINNRSPLK